MRKQIGDNHHKEDSITTYIKKNTKKYLLWTLIYLPLAIVHYVRKGYSFWFSVAFYLRGLIFTGDHYNSAMLWWLLSAVYAGLFLLLCKKKGVSDKAILLLGALIGILFSIILDCLAEARGLESFLGIIGRFVYYSFGNGRIFKGLFYIPLGWYIAGHSIENIWSSLLCFLVGTMGIFVLPGSLENIGISISSYGLFVIIAAVDLKNRMIYKVCREVSTVIYFFAFVGLECFLLCNLFSEDIWDGMLCFYLAFFSFVGALCELVEKKKAVFHGAA